MSVSTESEKVALTNKDIWISPDTLKLLAFFIGAYLCYALDYGALSNILDLDESLRAKQASWIDYLLTGAVLRLGGGGIADLFSALTGRLQAVKAEAKKITDMIPQKT